MPLQTMNPQINSITNQQDSSNDVDVDSEGKGVAKPVASSPINVSILPKWQVCFVSLLKGTEI